MQHVDFRSALRLHEITIGLKEGTELYPAKEQFQSFSISIYLRHNLLWISPAYRNIDGCIITLCIDISHSYYPYRMTPVTSQSIFSVYESPACPYNLISVWIAISNHLLYSKPLPLSSIQYSWPTNSHSSRYSLLFSLFSLSLRIHLHECIHVYSYQTVHQSQIYRSHTSNLPAFLSSFVSQYRDNENNAFIGFSRPHNPFSRMREWVSKWARFIARAIYCIQPTSIQMEKIFRIRLRCAALALALRCRAWRYASIDSMVASSSSLPIWWSSHGKRKNR